MSRELSHAEQLADRLLQATHDTTLDDFLLEARGRDLSFEKIARELEEATGVRLTWQTMRRWINARVAA